MDDYEGRGVIVPIPQQRHESQTPAHQQIDGQHNRIDDAAAAFHAIPSRSLINHQCGSFNDALLLQHLLPVLPFDHRITRYLLSDHIQQTREDLCPLVISLCSFRPAGPDFAKFLFGMCDADVLQIRLKAQDADMGERLQVRYC